MGYRFLAFRTEKGVETLNPRFSSGATKRAFHPPAGFLLGILGLLSVSAVIRAQSVSSSGQMYFSRLGCANCHGEDGHGAVGKPGGPDIDKTRLPLRRFVGYVRMPIGMMPPHAPEWAPDAELAAVYSWLEGVDAVRPPPPITVEMDDSPEVKAEGNAKAQIQIEITVLRVQTALNSMSQTRRLCGIG